MSLELTSLLKGALLGFAIAAPVGPGSTAGRPLAAVLLVAGVVLGSASAFAGR